MPSHEHAADPAATPSNAAHHGHGHGHAHGHGHGHGGAEKTDFAPLAEYLDLDGVVFSDFLAKATGLVRASVDTPDAVRRVADLGCGTGTATFALAGLFPQSRLIAVDVAEPLLEHLEGRAEAAGLADRVTTLTADLDQGWPDELHDLDVVWASTSIHHLADVPACLAAIRDSLGFGGVLALVEVDDLEQFHPAFLPEGFDRRLRISLADDWRAMMPLLGADWGAVLADNGFALVGDHVFDIELPAPLPRDLAPHAARFAELSLARLREALDDTGRAATSDPDDLAALDAVLAEGLAGRTDLAPRTRRRLYLARPA